MSRGYNHKIDCSCKLCLGVAGFQPGHNLSKGENNSMHGKENKWGKHTEIMKQKMKEKNCMYDIKIKKKHQQSITTIKYKEGQRKDSIERWKNKEYAKKVIENSLKGLLKRPTTFEQKISDLCIKYNLPFLYKGNGSFLINYKNPDFVNEKDKIVIEVFYSWFKIRDYGSVENYKEFCKRKYESAGWKVIFIDELDLSNENWEEVCLNKIKW